jgi:hypothetical protein
VNFKDLKDERVGNNGRREWNKRRQTAEEAQAMLAGAANTIDRLLDILEAKLKEREP